jgi:hypothetical protein
MTTPWPGSLAGTRSNVSWLPYVRMWPGILRSDEAIVAVIAHEMHELGSLRPGLERDVIIIDDLVLQTEPGRPGNLHCQAWDVADKLVNQMRGGPAT